MYYIFLINSSVNGYLGCFRVLALVNRAAVNIGVHVSLNFTFLLINAQEWDCWIISKFYI